MPTFGIAKKPGTCAICAKGFPKGAKVYHDPYKSMKNCLVHQKCWDDLRASRDSPLPKKKKAVKVLSVVELDPPF